MPSGWTPLSYTAMRQGNTTRCHAGHQFYKDALDVWQDVDYTLDDMGTYWELTKASYRLRIAKDFGAPALIQYTNRFEGANHQIVYEPHSIWWIDADAPIANRTKFRDALSVTGTYDTATQTITWVNAFGPGVDFEVVIMRSGFKKQIVAKSAPPPGPYANNWLVPVFKWTATGLTLRDQDGGAWDNDAYFEADEFSIEEIASPANLSYIKRAIARDANDKKRNLRVMFEKRAGVLWQGKIIPESLLLAATYPVRADTVTTAYSGAGDGDVNMGGSSSWDTIHDAATGNQVDYTNTDIFVDPTVEGDGANIFMKRAFLPIDTSGISDTDVISGASLKIYILTTTNQDNDGDDWITVVQTTQASTSTLATADFNQCGDSVDNPTEGIDSGDRKDITSISTSAYLTFSLNSTGVGWIDKAGFTKLGLREGHDVIDSAVQDLGDPTASKITFSSSENTGTSQDPYLEVTHTSIVTLDYGADNYDHWKQGVKIVG